MHGSSTILEIVYLYSVYNVRIELSKYSTLDSCQMAEYS